MIHPHELSHDFPMIFPQGFPIDVPHDFPHSNDTMSPMIFPMISPSKCPGRRSQPGSSLHRGNTFHCAPAECRENPTNPPWIPGSLGRRSESNMGHDDIRGDVHGIMYEVFTYIQRYIPVVPHEAVAEVSKIGNLQNRLIFVNHGWQSELVVDRKMVGVPGYTSISSSLVYQSGLVQSSLIYLGGSKSFKNKQRIGEVGYCESRISERTHRQIERWLECKAMHLSIFSI